MKRKPVTVTVSVVLAVYNEAKNIARCLRSIHSFADEIIVVDGDSTDETVAIAKTFSAKIISTSNKTNFHINKQMAIDAATCQIILQLDADEVVDHDLSSFIGRIKRKPNDYQSVAAWRLRRKNYFLGKWLKKGGQYPDPVIRLFWKGKAALPQKDVHEQMEVQGEIGWAEGHLEHHSNPTLSTYLEKMNTYTSFAAQALHLQSVPINISTGVRYCFIKPMVTFVSLSIRHKGLLDGSAGFLFALMSALHYPLQFYKLWELYETK